jgi:hypothetical protein
MPNLDYSGYDYETALSQLETKLSAQDGWKDRVQSATGQILLSLMAYVIDMDGYKIDRRATELYRDFARLRTSIVAIAWNLGYEPRRKVGSVCTLRFSTTTPPLIIPEGVVCSSAGGVKFATTEQGTITLGYVDLSAKQRGPKSLNFTCGGTAGQYSEIPSTGDGVEAVENTSVVVAVGGTTWTKVDSFVGQTDTAQVYRLERKGDRLRVIFGDNKNGKIPDNGDVVAVSWLETLGADGDVAGTGTITTIDSGVTGATVTNTDAAQGGEDEEGIEEIRDNMSQVFATGQRAVTAADYRALLLAYNGVAKATAYGEQEQLGGAASNPDYAWRVVLVVVPTGGGTLTRTQEVAIKAYLDALKVVTSYITFTDPTYIPVDFVVTAKISTGYDLNTVKTAIEAALDGIVNFQDIDLGESLRYSDVIAAIEAVDGVVFSQVNQHASYDGGAGTGIVGYSGTIPIVPIAKNTVTVYLETIADGTRRRVGYDDGSGNMTSNAAIDNPRVTGGAINYTTGVYSLTFNGVVSGLYQIYVDYQTANLANKVFGTGDGVEVTFTGFLEKNLAPSFVDIYEEGVLVASDDGSGVFVDAGDGRVTTGTVDYETGDVSVTFAAPAPSPDAQISCAYYRETQDVEVGVSQMVLMGNKDVTTELQST